MIKSIAANGSFYKSAGIIKKNGAKAVVYYISAKRTADADKEQ